MSNEPWGALEIFTACGAKTDELVAGDFSRNRSSQGLHTAATAINSYADAGIADLHALFAQQGDALACHAGCSHCCHGPVHLSPLELLNIALHLDSTAVAPAQRTELHARIEAKNLRVRGMSVETQTRTIIPCPFLLESQCSIYAVRPLFCRGRNAIDLAPCLAGYAHPEQNVPMQMLQEQMLIGQSLVMGILIALKKIGLPDQFLDLSLATATALTTPDLVDRWLGGENPLSHTELRAQPA